MRVISNVLEAITRLENKWGLQITIQWPDDLPVGALDLLPEVSKACLFLEVGNEEHEQVVYDGGAYFLFDTKDEMEKAFLQCVMDGPTELNNYTGPVKVHAVTCSPTGVILDENT